MGEENEVSANSNKSAEVLQEEQPCCSEMALKVGTVVEDVASDEILSVR